MHLMATALLPYDNADRARSALRARLHDIIQHRQIPEAAFDGAKMLVAGPTVVTDASGHEWFEWVATLTTRPTVRESWLSVERKSRPTVDELRLLRRQAS